MKQFLINFLPDTPSGKPFWVHTVDYKNEKNQFAPQFFATVDDVKNYIESVTEGN